jgi:hypothetical protein
MSRDSHRNFLYVEGKDDQAVFRSLLHHYCIIDVFDKRNEPFKINDHEGVDNLLTALKVALKSDDTQRFGVVVDADIDLSKTWQRLYDILSFAGYRDVSSVPDPQGTIIKQELLPTVGIWLMPDNQLPGMMEDFISFLRPVDDIFWPMAEDIVQKVIDKGARFRPTHRSKACLHTWLAWQKEPGKPMGLAITKRFVDLNPYMLSFCCSGSARFLKYHWIYYKLSPKIWHTSCVVNTSSNLRRLASVSFSCSKLSTS